MTNQLNDNFDTAVARINRLSQDTPNLYDKCGDKLTCRL